MQVSNDSIIVAVTGDEPTSNLAEALPALNQLGANVSDVQWRGAFAFVAQQGFPDKTVLRKTAPSVAVHSSFIVTGNRFKKLCRIIILMSYSPK